MTCHRTLVLVHLGLSRLKLLTQFSLPLLHEMMEGRATRAFAESSPIEQAAMMSIAAESGQMSEAAAAGDFGRAPVSGAVLGHLRGS